jgi:hypothetical protein
LVREVSQHVRYAACTVAIVSPLPSANEPSTVPARPISAYDRPVIACDERRVLDQAEQRRPRGHEATTCLLLGEIVQRIMQAVSVLVDDLLDALAVFGGPVKFLSMRHCLIL